MFFQVQMMLRHLKWSSVDSYESLVCNSLFCGTFQIIKYVSHGHESF